MATISGVVTIGFSNVPGEATVVLFNYAGETIVATTVSDPVTGAYEFTGLAGGFYRVAVMGGSVYRSRVYGPCSVSDVTLNPADKHADLTLSHGDLRATRGAGSGWRSVRSTTSRNSGSIYFEAQSGASSSVIAGLMVASTALTSYAGQFGQDCGWAMADTPDSRKYNPGESAIITGFGAVVSGGFAHFAADITAGKLWFRKGSGGGWAGGGDPAAGTLPTLSFTPGTTFFVAACVYNAGEYLHLNFGQNTFDGEVPSGFGLVG